MRSRSQELIFLIFFLQSFSFLAAKISALWITPWDLNTPTKVDNIINDAVEWGITDLLVEVRYRADTFYTPNKQSSIYQNCEPFSYLLMNTSSEQEDAPRSNKPFDVLEYFIAHTKETNLRVHAWVTVNVVTPRVLDQLPQNHLYYTKPHWLTYHQNGRVMGYEKFEGAYLDPGLPDVQDYLVQIFSDLVDNYDIDGLHLDYIRYPQRDYGYHPQSLELYAQRKKIEPRLTFEEWKERQIIELITKIGKNIKSIKPDLLYSAAVIPEANLAKARYAQDWYTWLDTNIIDHLYLMAYTTSNNELENYLKTIPQRYRHSIIVGLRAWTDDGKYKINQLRDKITLVSQEYAGIAFFSYGGIIKNNFQNPIQEYKPQKFSGYVYGQDQKPLSGAKITHRNDQSIFTFSDRNGYFYFLLNNVLQNDFICSYLNFSQIKTGAYSSELYFNLPVYSRQKTNCSGIEAEEGFFLWWDYRKPVALYRKNLKKDDHYVFLGNFDRKTYYYYDHDVSPFDLYEYKIVYDQKYYALVYKTLPIYIPRDIDVRIYYQDEKINFEFINRKQLPGIWFLEELTSKRISEGELGVTHEIIKIPDQSLKQRFLLFTYRYQNQEYMEVVDLVTLRNRKIMKEL